MIRTRWCYLVVSVFGGASETLSVTLDGAMFQTGVVAVFLM